MLLVHMAITATERQATCASFIGSPESGKDRKTMLFLDIRAHFQNSYIMPKIES
ncbi:hypothetical protein ACVS9P_08325 [Caproicibacterium sp. NSD3]